METKYEIIPIFPTPLYINKIPEQLVQNHISLLDNEPLLGEKDGVFSKEFGDRSLNTYILNGESYQNLNNYILQHAINYAKKGLGYNYQEYKFSQSWISVKNPNQHHTPHNHAHSLISGILFFGKCNSNTSSITFMRKDEYSRTFFNHPKLESSLLNEFSSLEYLVPFTPNLLIFFPSYLLHGVLNNNTNIPRKSLAFNIVPRDGFGQEEDLNELKFNN